MPKHILVWDEGKDNIEMYSKHSITVVFADRSEISILGKISEVRLPAIYILLGTDKAYVGQASGDVMQRLRNHNKKKEWWEKVVFLTRDDGKLDKSQLDYLEAKIINILTERKINLDNGTIGNSSHIDSYQRSIAEEFFATAIDLLENTAHIKIFTSQKYRTSKNYFNVVSPYIMASTKNLSKNKNNTEKDSVTKSENINSYATQKDKIFTILKNEKVFYESKKLRPGFILLMEDICKNSNHIDILKERYKSPKGNDLFGSLDIVAEEKNYLYYCLSNGYYVYQNYSISTLKKQIEELSKLLNVNYRIEEK